MPMNPRIAERHAFVRPDSDAPADARHDIYDELIHHRSMPTAALVGRFLIAAIFLVSGVAKLTDLPGTVSHMAAAGIPYADTLALVAGCGEILGGLAIAAGFLTRFAAGGLILYLIPTTWIFHAFWNASGEQHLQQMVNFLKNLAIMGGLAVLMAQGPGRFSLDHRIRRAAARRRARREV